MTYDRVGVAHVPVLRDVVVQMLNIKEDGVYVDATVGEGGHANAILHAIGRYGKIIGIDRDSAALQRARARLADSRVVLTKGDFADIERILAANGVWAVDGILFDLGMSSMQLKNSERGFSFTSDAALDMRMDITLPVSARDMVNRFSERDLERIFREFGEEPRARAIARAIIHRRQKRPIETCAELAAIIVHVYRGKRGRIHPATKVFQALRIAVNQELDQLERGLEASLRLLRPAGRLCVISYHSIEDRIVKRFMVDRARCGELNMVTRKPLTPSREEIVGNPSARSAKLRVAEKTS